MSVLIKICGLKTPLALDAALDAGADLVGFVFFAPSPRHIGYEAARALGARVAGRARKVAVSVDAGDDLLQAAIAALQPDVLQLHGRETPERVALVRSRFGLPVVKALPVSERADLAGVRLFAKVADRIMLDARAPHAATRPGGHGLAFDWRLLEDLALGVPFMLSGGLNAGNVAEALAITRSPAVDVSSGVERATGDKDAGKIREFISAARAAARAVPGSEREASREERAKAVNR
jgi:phosphoribosylanthranilate isomerase